MTRMNRARIEALTAEGHGWIKSAECRGSAVDFYATERTGTREALAVCAVCPVVAACLADALDGPVGMDQGVRGGMTERDRLALRSKLGLPHRWMADESPLTARRRTTEAKQREAERAMYARAKAKVAARSST